MVSTLVVAMCSSHPPFHSLMWINKTVPSPKKKRTMTRPPNLVKARMVLSICTRPSLFPCTIYIPVTFGPRLEVDGPKNKEEDGMCCALLTRRSVPLILATDGTSARRSGRARGNECPIFLPLAST